MSDELLEKLRYTLFTAKRPHPKVRLDKIVSSGDQLHGEPMRYAHFTVLESGYGYKKGVKYAMEFDTFKVMVYSR